MVNVGDYGLRDRQMFHQVLPYIPETNSPTLVVLDSRAWGHVLRLVYYIDNPAVDILASDPAAVTEALAEALTSKDYDTVIWLHAQFPLWSAPETATEAAKLKAETEQLLQARFDAIAAPRFLSGTMNLDRFELQPYTQKAS